MMEKYRRIFMTLGKIGTTIGEKIIAWTRTSGSKSLLATKPVKVTLSDLKYTSKLKTDTFVKKLETWFDPVGHVAPYAQRGRTEVVGHHVFNAWNSNKTIEDVMGVFMKKYPNASQEQIQKVLIRTQKRIASSNLEKIDYNRQFLSLEPQPYNSVAFRGRQRRIGEQLGSDFDIIEKAQVGDEIVPTSGFAYAAHHKFGAYQYMGSPFDYNGNIKFEPMLIEYRIPKGSQVSSNMEHGGEVVFPAFSKYKLVSKDTRLIERLDTDGNAVGLYPYKHVILEYIPEIPVFRKDLAYYPESVEDFLLTKAMQCKNFAEFADLPQKLGL